MQGRGVEAEDAVRAGAAEDGGHTHQEVGTPLLTPVMKCPLSRYATYHGLALAADLASLALVGLGTLFFMDVDPLGLATGKLIQSHI